MDLSCIKRNRGDKMKEIKMLYIGDWCSRFIYVYMYCGIIYRIMIL